MFQATATAQVSRAPKFKDVDGRPYKKVSFWVYIEIPSHMEGDDLIPSRNRRVCLHGTPDVAVRIEAEGLHVNEMIKVQISDFGSFCQHKADNNGGFFPPGDSFTITSYELLSRPDAKAKAKAGAAAA